MKELSLSDIENHPEYKTCCDNLCRMTQSFEPTEKQKAIAKAHVEYILGLRNTPPLIKDKDPIATLINSKLSNKELLSKSLTELKEIILSDTYPVEIKKRALKLALLKSKRNWP